MNFPICARCPLGLICSASAAYDDKRLCHCKGCKQVLMVFTEVSRETINEKFSGMLKKAGRRGRTGSLSRYGVLQKLFDQFYNTNVGETLVVVLGDFRCPLPYEGADQECPDCAKKRRIKESEQ